MQEQRSKRRRLSWRETERERESINDKMEKSVPHSLPLPHSLTSLSLSISRSHWHIAISPSHVSFSVCVFLLIPLSHCLLSCFRNGKTFCHHYPCCQRCQNLYIHTATCVLYVLAIHIYLYRQSLAQCFHTHHQIRSENFDVYG